MSLNWQKQLNQSIIKWTFSSSSSFHTHMSSWKLICHRQRHCDVHCHYFLLLFFFYIWSSQLWLIRLKTNNHWLETLSEQIFTSERQRFTNLSWHFFFPSWHSNTMFSLPAFDTFSFQHSPCWLEIHIWKIQHIFFLLLLNSTKWA